jgi:hypothetical protein
MKPWLHGVLLATATCFVAYLFANVEIQIEGSAGWASNLPTWRIEEHPLLDLFFGGRAMTGYHAWILPCILAFFIIFWIVEDALWFICNPAFGWERLAPAHATWHKHWFLGLPLDYWIFAAIGTALFVWSFRKPRCTASSSPAV